MTRGITILLPTFNEVGALPGVVESLPLKELREAGWSPRIVVADGRSTDGTQELVTKMGPQLLTQAKQYSLNLNFRKIQIHTVL